MVHVGTMGLFWPGYSPFQAVGGGGLVGCVQSRELGARAPCLPRFILLGSFSDTLLVVSILDMIAICIRFCSPEGVTEVLQRKNYIKN